VVVWLKNKTFNKVCVGDPRGYSLALVVEVCVAQNGSCFRPKSGFKVSILAILVINRVFSQ